MNLMIFARGSEWRCWDLHVHTPYSAHNTNFSGSTFEEKWAQYVDALGAISNVSVIGITDYFSIEGYKSLLLEREAGKLPNLDLILPNVEIRLDISTQKDKAVNLHLIFSPEVVNQLDAHFFAQLKFEYQGTHFTATRADIIKLGRKFEGNDALEEQAAFKKGAEQFKVSFEKLRDLFKTNAELRKNTFIVVADHSGDGASGVRDHGLKALREEIYRFCDALFCPTPNTISYFLGTGIDSEEEVCRKFGSLKPCIHGSDAHSLEEICKPDEDRFTWIKADPTFDGLKQIIFEPKERVRIQPTSPKDGYKKSYFDKLNLESGPIFQDSDLEFISGEIELNSNLVCIVGGRGSGKSVLLGATRKTFEKSDPKSPDDSSKDILLSQFRVQFKKADESIQEYKIREANNLDYLHVSQGEVKHIVLNAEKLDQELKKMLQLSDPGEKIFQSEEMYRIANKIIEIRQTLKHRNESGELDNVESYHLAQKKRYEELIGTITTETNRTLIQKYISNQGLIAKLNDTSRMLDDVERELVQSQALLGRKIGVLNSLGFDFNIPNLNVDECTAAVAAAKIHTLERLHECQQANGEITDEFLRSGIEGDVATLLEKVQLYQNRLDEHDAAISKTKALHEEMADQVRALGEESRKLEGRLNDYLVTLRSSWTAIKQGKEGWTTEQVGLIRKLLDGIEIDGIVELVVTELFSIISDLLNRTKFKATRDEGADDRIRAMFCINTVSDFFGLLRNEPVVQVDGRKVALMDILDLDIFLKSGDEAFLKLVTSGKSIERFLKARCQLTYRGKPPKQLSIGQRGTLFVCLKLATDTFGVPFVFDQPEDDLDNNFIMTSLVPLFRELKRYRQVIVVTHNANLVVNADAEQIIVASNEGEKLAYRSGSLEARAIPGFADRRKAFPMKDKICDILEGGRDAFKRREQKYGIER